MRGGNHFAVTLLEADTPSVILSPWKARIAGLPYEVPIFTSSDLVSGEIVLPLHLRSVV
jgi:hypothetical protein